MKLILVRHPETEALVNHIIYGQTHSPYTENGRKSVAWAAERLAEDNIAQIYSSPMERAFTLANGIAERHPGLEVKTDPRIIEMSCGIFEQLSFEEARALAPEHADPFLNDFGNYRAPGAEIFSDVKERTSDFLKDVIQAEDELRKEGHPERPIVVVSHAMAMRGMLSYLFDIKLSELWHLKLNPACIIRIKYDSGFSQLEGMTDPTIK